MKYLVGGKHKLITSNLDAEFQQARGSMEFIDVQGPKAQRGFGRSTTAAADGKLRSTTGGVDYTRAAPLFNDPRYTSSTLSIPVDNRTLNGLYRFFAETDPITGSAISVHGTLPLADFKLGQCEDSGVQQHYEDMWERINGYKLISDIVTELLEIGDCLVPDSLIYTLRGLVKIKDIQVGDLVLTASGKFERVLRVLPKTTTKDLYQITPWKINLFRPVTSDHRIKTDAGWVRAEKLQVGDYVEIAVPETKFEDVSTIPLPVKKEVKNVFKIKPDVIQRYKRIIDWLQHLKKPVVMRYAEVAKKVGCTESALIAAIVLFEKRGATVLKKRIYIPEETTQWTGIDLHGLFLEQITNGVSVRTFTSDISEIAITNDFMYMLGYWLGDGCIARTEYMGKRYGMAATDWDICFSQKFKYIANHISRTSKAIFGKRIPVTGGMFRQDMGDREGAPLHLHIHNPIFCSWWEEQFQGTCWTKRIPEWVMNLPEEKLKYLLGGLIDSDGCVINNGFSISTVNATLMLQIFYIGLKLGYPFLIHERQGGKFVPYPMHKEKTIVESTFYTVTFSDRKRAPELLGYSRKNKKVFKSRKTSQSRDRFKFENGKWYAEIKTISHTSYKGTAYDLMVENTPNFSSGGIVVHNCTSFGAWDEASYMWSQFAILNPDYVKIESTWVNQQPLIKLIPDEALKKIVTTRSPEFIYKQLPPEIIQYVLFNQEIPLDPNNVFHIAKNKRPYETRGRSMIKRVLKLLMLEDRFNQANFAIATRHAVPMTLVKVGSPTGDWLPTDEDIDDVRAAFCHDDQTEVLTDAGFKKYNVVLPTDKIACFNPAVGAIEFYLPLAKHVFDYSGDLVHFNSRSMDVMVTPNHRMYAQRGTTYKRTDWQIVKAKDVNYRDRFRACADKHIAPAPLSKTFIIEDTPVDTGDLFELIGWYLSEGYKNTYEVTITQSPKKYFKQIQSLLSRLPWPTRIRPRFGTLTLKSRALATFMESNFGSGSLNKKIPRWVLDSNEEYLKRLLVAFTLGDGSNNKRKDAVLEMKTLVSISKPMLDAFQEICIKLGYGTRLYTNPGDVIMHHPVTKVKYSVRPSGKRKGEKYDKVYLLQYSNGTMMRFPGLHDIETRVPIAREVKTFLVAKRGKKKGRFDWSKIDLKGILEYTGSADAAGKFLGCSGVAVRAQMKKAGIPAGNPGQRLGTFDWSQNKHIQRVPYKGKVWCFTVPHGLFVTRRGEYVTVQGNSNYELDPNFSLFYHFGIAVEFIGASGKTLPVGPELDRINKWKMIGLEINEQILAGTGGSYSVAEDHLIAYDVDGARVIESFKDVWSKTDKPIIVSKEYEIKDVSDLRMSTVSLDAAGVQQWTAITKLIRHKLTTKDRLLDVKTSTAVVTSTTGHGFMHLHPETWKYEEVAAKNLAVNSTLVDIINLQEFGKEYKEIWYHNLTPELSYFLGVWNADGCLGIKNGYDLIFSSNNIKLINHVTEIAKTLPFERVLLRTRPIAGEHTLYLHWYNLKMDLLEFYGIPLTSSTMRKTGKERIPEEILFNSDPKVVGAYIAGELDGDGYVTGNQVGFVSASKRYLQELSFLLRRFNVIPNAVKECTNTEETTKFKITMKVYNVLISDTQSFTNLRELTQGWLGLDYKRERLQKLTEQGSRELNRNMYINKASTDSILCNRQRALKSKKYSIFEKHQISMFDTVRVVNVLPSERPSEYVYDLELVTVPHTYIVCGDGWLLNHNSQAYINLEVQRQRYLNMQLKLEQLVHQGWFKVVADMCGFYKLRNSLGHTSAKSAFGKEGLTPLMAAQKQFSSLRDFQDNQEFLGFIEAKTAEDQQVLQVRDYVYPKCDWGAMSAATDENMKNYLKWLQKERPWLVDDATLARLARLDRDTQEKAYIKDLERKRDRLLEVNKLGLGPLAMPTKVPPGGDMGDVGGDFGGGITSTPSIGEMPPEPNAPIGEGGAPDTAGGTVPPAGPGPTASKKVQDGIVSEGQQMVADMLKDDVLMLQENTHLRATKTSREDQAIEHVIWNRVPTV